MNEIKNNYENSINKYIKHVDIEISRHEKYISRIIITIIFIAITSSVYAAVIIYRQNNIVKDYSSAIKDIKIEIEKIERSNIKEIIPKINNLNHELLNYYESPEKNKTIILLEDIKKEFTLLRDYVSTLNSHIKSNSEIEIESIESIKEHIDRVHYTLKSLGREPHQKISRLQEIVFDLSFEPTDIFNGEELNMLIEKHIKGIESLRPSSYELYMFVSLFLLCFTVLISLYKYHHNKISTASAEKSRILQLSLLLKIENDNGNKHEFDKIKEVLSASLHESSKSYLNSKNPVKKLVDGVSTGLKRDEEGT